MCINDSDMSDIQSNSLITQDINLSINWEDVICPICLDFPHNVVLLYCSSYDNGCRPFMCDTDHTHSNCLNRFKSAYGLPNTASAPTTNEASGGSSHEIPCNSNRRPICPLCRGDVTGWVVIDEARAHLDLKKRSCEEARCSYVGNYLELQTHALHDHPHARPSEIDPARQLDWENLQQSSEIIDVLSTIHSEVPHGVVMGDYVIDYGNESGDEYEDFPGDEGNWWTSCILYQVFDNFRSSRNQQRLRTSEIRTDSRRLGYLDFDEASTSSTDSQEFRFDETEDEYVGAGGIRAVASRGSSSNRSYRRRRSSFLYR